MRLKKDSSNQKLRGAYYTPLQLAKAMVSLFAPQDMASVLEPSCGDGVFIDSFDELGLLPNIETLKAIEIEPDEAQKVRERYIDDDNVEIYEDDFFKYYNRVLGNETYDLIVGNPPYIRYQYLTDSQRKTMSYSRF